MKKLHKKIAKHLSEDMEGYRKERKYLKKEIKEDQDLKKKVMKNGSKKKACCEACEDHEREKPAKRRRVKASKKAGGK